MVDSKKKFAVFDIDGTLFRSGLYREVVYEMIAQQTAPISLVDSFSVHEENWKSRTNIDAYRDYEKAMVNAFDESLVNIKCEDFEKAAQNVFERMQDHVYVYTRDLVAKMKLEGRTLIAISGSQNEIVKLFAKKYGFDLWVGQQYIRDVNGRFTGEIIKTHNGKDKTLQKIVADNKLSFNDSLAIGDTGGDIGMLSIVENPIAFNPDAKLLQVAKENGWKIVVERKSLAYELVKGKNGQYILA